MLSLLGLDVPEETLEHWSELLVTAHAPYFLTDALADALRPHFFLLRREERSSLGLTLSHIDSYACYAVDQRGTWVVALAAAELQMLPASLREAVLRAQAELGRGQVYAWEAAAPLVTQAGCREQAEAWRVDDQFVLDHSIWKRLPSELQADWLAQFVSRDQLTSHSMTPEEWSQLARRNEAQIRWMVGWPHISGPNCFSTSLAAVLPDAQQAELVSRMWLHAEPFLRGIAEQGFVLNSDVQPGDARLRDAVLVWQDESGQLLHSAYLLGSGTVLNKNAQCWFAPRQLVALDDLIQQWSDEPLKIVVYTRA
jgi:hypothetical protein